MYINVAPIHIKLLAALQHTALLTAPLHIDPASALSQIELLAALHTAQHQGTIFNADYGLGMEKVGWTGSAVDWCVSATVVIVTLFTIHYVKKFSKVLHFLHRY